MNKIPTLAQVRKAKEQTVWSFTNKVLYDLCKKNFRHDQNDIILAKTLIIGRSYSVALERMREKDVISNEFYIDKVAPALNKSKIDFHLEQLQAFKKLSMQNIDYVLKTHFYLTKRLNKITNQNKRSFSSKYLHFHLPDLYFIYDSRAGSALRNFISRVPEELKPYVSLKDVDKAYATFVCKSFALKQQIESGYNLSLTTRQFDNLLIGIADKKASSKMLLRRSY
jgi:hypothetical protein